MASQQSKTQQIKTLVGGLSLKKRLLIGGTALAVGAAILLNAWRSDADFRPLYNSLSPEDAGAIAQKLKEKNVAFKVSDSGTSISVPSAKVGEARLEMAAAGLPKTGRIGFELFDKTHLGATDFTEHVNMRRALEGELERSVSSMAEVENARVHITFPKDSVFAENRLPAKASVMLKLRSQLSEQNVAAVRYLVASAVEGLAPESVSVLDMRGNLLGRPKDKTSGDGTEASDAQIDYRQQLEKSLVTKVNVTLEPLLGADRFRASVVADCDFTSGEQSEEILDPARSVLTSEQRSKESSSLSNSSGVPGTASNLPRATARPGSTTGITKESMSANYQTSRLVKRTRTPQGAVRRLSASVLVDQTVRWQGTGAHAKRILVPPSAETMSRITQVVSAAVGIVPERGDKLVVETLPFEATLNQEPPPDPAPKPLFPLETMSSPNMLFLLGAAAIAAIVIWLMLHRAAQRRAAEVELKTQPALTPPAAGPSPAGAAAAVAAGSAGTAGAMQTAAVTAATKANTAAVLEQQIEDKHKRLEDEQLSQIEATGLAMQRLTAEVRDLATQDSELCAGVLRAWLTEPEPNASGH